MKKLKVVLMGAGQRGETYTDIMLNMPERFEVIAVAEPIKSRREFIKENHNISADLCLLR